MSRTRPLLVALLAAVVALPTPAQPPKARKVAFLVGVGEFKHDPKRLGGSPKQDVTKLAVELQEGGFEVVILTDAEATKEAIEAKFKAVLDGGGKAALGNKDLLLVALCSHGFTVETVAADGTKKAEPYLAAHNTRLGQTNTMVSLNGLIEQSRSFAPTALFLVDACREVNDPNRGPRGIEGKQVVLPKRTAVLFACGEGQLSHQSEKADGHGLFTFAVLKTMRAGGGGNWDRMVSGVKEAFETDEIKKMMPPGATQTPILATGELGFTALLTKKADGGDIEKGPADGKYSTSKTTGMKFVRIPKGTFEMGSPKDEEDRSSDEDLHEVTLTKDYYLGVYEVTRGQFRKFVDDTGYRTEGEADGKGGYGWDAAAKMWKQDAKYTWKNVGFEQTDDHPVVLVSWNDAVKFCEWQSKKDEKEYRLPSEAEWEFACRAGSRKRFSFGDDDEELAKHGNVADEPFRTATGKPYGIKASDGFGFTAPVGKFKANAFGLYDMHGNAWEWCQDYYGEYAKVGNSRDPIQLNKQSDDRRVVRGGSWVNFAEYCRAAFRFRGALDTRNNDYGFRVCLPLD